MNRIAASILALSAAAIVNTSASAIAFTGNFFIAGFNRVVTTGVTQGAAAANLATLPVRVTLCSGVIEMPPFVVTGATTAVATGSCYRIYATVVAADRFRLIIAHNGSAAGTVRQVALGGAMQKTVFDRRDPNPGTSFSGSGRDVTPTGGAGPSNYHARWTNPIAIGTMPARGDVFNRIEFNFDPCLAVQGYAQVEFDIDEVM